MPVARSKRAKKSSSSNVKLPKNLLPLTKAKGPFSNKEKKTVTIEKDVEEFVDSLAQTDWQSYLERPRFSLFGFYIIAKWMQKCSKWVIIYLGRGRVTQKLDLHFSGRRTTAIDYYLSSFPKDVRKQQLWIKWIKDPFYPNQGIEMESLIEAIQYFYNGDAKPAFNDLDDVKVDEELPANFSILDYCKKI